MRRRAFTLVELLVVISIIALLIAILLPSLKKSREQAKQTVCQSNLRSMMLAVMTYAANNDDHLVSAGLAHGGSINEHAAWINTLQAEYGNKLVARCPADRSRYWITPLPGVDPPQLRRASYASNYYTVKKIGGRGPYDRLSMFRRPADTVHMAELTEGATTESRQYAASDHVHPETWWSDPLRLARKELALDRHTGRAGYNFLDGHAATLPFPATFAVDEEASNFPEYLVFKRNLYNPAIAPGGKDESLGSGQ